MQEVLLSFNNGAVVGCHHCMDEWIFDARIINREIFESNAYKDETLYSLWLVTLLITSLNLSSFLFLLKIMMIVLMVVTLTANGVLWTSIFHIS